MEKRTRLLKKWIANWTTVADIAKSSGVPYRTLYAVIDWNRPLSEAVYEKLYAGMDKKISKDMDILQDFGLKN